MVFNHLYQLPWISKIQIFIYGPIFGLLGGPFFGLRRQKMTKKSKLFIFHYFSCWNFFFHFFSEWQLYILGNFSYKKVWFEKKSIFFFKNFPLVPPMDVFSSFGGPRVVAADLSCSRVASVHCDFVGVCGGAVFWPEKDSLKRANLSLGEILTRHRYIF